MKICHIITRMIIGGAQENTLFTCLDHIAKGHEVTLITGEDHGREGNLLNIYNIKNGQLKIVYTPYLVRELDIKNDVLGYRFLKNYLKQEKFDVVHTHASKAGILGRIAARHAKVPVVVHTVHGQAFHLNEKWWKNSIYKFSERVAACYCDKIFAVSQAMIEQGIKAKIAKREKYMLVYSGMAIEEFLNSSYHEELALKFGISKEKVVIGSVARLFEYKGYDYFLPAALDLLKRNKSLEFLIVGDGKMYDELVGKINASGYTEHFHFAGLIAPNEVYKYLSIMDILWHFSVREGLPRSVVQALASGVVPMGFKLDGTPEVILNNESGCCIDYACNNFEKNLNNIILESERLIGDKLTRDRFGVFGKALVAEKFSHEYMSEVLEKEYQNLHNKSKKS